MATMPEKFMKQVKLGDNTYEIIAGFLNDGNGGAKDWADIQALVTAGFTIEVPWIKTDYESATAPTAEKLATVPAITVYYNNGASTATGTLAASSSEAKKHIYLVYHPHESGEDKFDEYVANTNDNTWEKIGNTDIDLSNYVQKGTYAGTAASAGAHTHSVSGTTAVPTIAKTDKHLGINRSTDVALDTSAKSNALGENATFTTTVTPTTTNIKATASGAAISTSGDTFVKSYPGVTSKLVKGSVIPAVANGQVVPAVANGKATKTVFGTDATASKVTIGTSAAAASKATAGTAVVYGTADVDTAVSIPNVTENADVTASHVTSAGSTTAGSAAAWSASVDASGVLSFSFTANTPTAVTLPTFEDAAASKVTLGTAISVTPAKAADTTRKITPYTFADVDIPTISASDVAVPVVSSNDEVDVAKAGTAVDVAKAGDAVQFATGALDAEGAGASIMTGLGTAVTADALTSAGISAQPIIALATGAEAGSGVVSVATGITSASTAINEKDAVAALTGVSVSAQPVFALDNTAASGVAYVQDITVGSEDVALESGLAASDGAHEHTTSVTL